MANQPRTFGGRRNHGQQWPPSYPTTTPSNFPSNPEHVSAVQPSPVSLGLPFEYNMGAFNANAQVPGYGGQGLVFPPPFPFMSHLDSSQIPNHIPPMAMPPFGFPPLPPPPGSSNPPPAALNPSAKNFSQPLGSQSQGRRESSNREEGEVSEGGRSVASKPNTKLAKRNRSRWPSAAQPEDLEEGETVSNTSQSSSRSSSRMCQPSQIVLVGLSLTLCSLQSSFVSFRGRRCGQPCNRDAEARWIDSAFKRLAAFQVSGAASASSTGCFTQSGAPQYSI